MNTLFPILLCAILSAFPEIETKIDAVGLLLEKASPEGTSVGGPRSHGELSGELEVGFSRWARPFAKLSLIDNTLVRHECLEATMLDCLEYSDSIVEVRTYRGEALRVGWKVRPFDVRGLRGIEIAPYYRYGHLVIESTPLRGQQGYEQWIRSDAIGIGIDWHIQLSRNILIEPFWYGDWGRYRRGSDVDPSRVNTEYQYDRDDEQRFGVHVGVVF